MKPSEAILIAMAYFMLFIVMCTQAIHIDSLRERIIIIEKGYKK